MIRKFRKLRLRVLFIIAKTLFNYIDSIMVTLEKRSSGSGNYADYQDYIDARKLRDAFLRKARELQNRMDNIK